MQLKSLTALLVPSLVVMSLLVAGCTTSTTNPSTTNQSSSSTSAVDETGLMNETVNPQAIIPAQRGTVTPDGLLAEYLAGLRDLAYANKNVTVTSWNVVWSNNTTARLLYAAFDKSVNQTVTYGATYIKFPTVQAATAYVNAKPTGSQMVQYNDIVKIPAASSASNVAALSKTMHDLEVEMANKIG